jgi:hypothetical protein
LTFGFYLLILFPLTLTLSLQGRENKEAISSSRREETLYIFLSLDGRGLR